jgi:predicted NUDIX family phosphoesterase
VKSQSGNYQAIYNQLIASTRNYFDVDLNFKYLGTIRDLANDNVKSILGNVYIAEINKDDFILKTKHDLYENKWYSKQELIDKYNKATSWSKIMIDIIVEELI